MQRNSPPTDDDGWKNFGNGKGYSGHTEKILDGGRKNWVKIFIKCEENILIFIERLQMFLGHILIKKFE